MQVKNKWIATVYDNGGYSFVYHGNDGTPVAIGKIKFKDILWLFEFMMFSEIKAVDELTLISE